MARAPGFLVIEGGAVEKGRVCEPQWGKVVHYRPRKELLDHLQCLKASLAGPDL